VPNQHEVRWSQLKIGLLVVVASVALALLVTLMSGSMGGFLHRRILVYSHFENASGLKPGAPVSLQGVVIGTVKSIRIDPTSKKTPVEVAMRLSTRYIQELHKDSVVSLSTVGVLGDTIVDIDSSDAVGPELQNGDSLAVKPSPSIQEVIKSSQGTIQQVNRVLAKLDTIARAINAGQGTVGLLVNDPQLYRHAVKTLGDLQHIADQINEGHGSLGKLIHDETFYNHLNDTVSHLQHITAELDSGHGTAGKLLKDPSLYNNLNQTTAKANELMAEINQGKGTLGMLAKDPKFSHKVNDTVTQMNVLLSHLNEGQGTAGKLLKDPSLYNNADRVMQDTHDLLMAIRKNPKQYLTFRVKIF
jgi:phospholipid/cholesterol/gamma-HCH transport system substrate-binding protein